MKTNLILTNDRPTYLQIMEYVHAQIAAGDLKPEDRLPAIRKLASILKIDPGTVARAYLELTKEGIIISCQGSGSYVTPVIGETAVLNQRRQRLDRIVESALIKALGLGFSIEDIETSSTLQLAEWRERRAPPSKKSKHFSKKALATIRFSGSHDLAIELLARHIGTLQPYIRMETNFVGSLSGLVALERGEADIAGAHLADEDTGEFNIPFIRKLMPNETVAVANVMQRIQGLIVAKGNPKNITGVEDLVRKDITFVNRQKGSGTRILLDSRLRTAHILPSTIKGYEHEETTHMAVAGLIARQKADIGMGVQSAANVSGLDFIPLFKERYDLIMLQDKLEKQPLAAIPDIVKSEDFINMIKSIPGYDTGDTGKITVVKPK